MKIIKRIVLIDDDKITNHLNKMIVDSVNIVDEIVVFDSPLAALNYFSNRPKENNGSLVLLDINMPAMDGWEFLRHYSTINKNLKVDTVVMLTSSIDPRDQKQAKENEFVSDIIYKPLSIKIINEVVKKHLK